MVVFWTKSSGGILSSYDPRGKMKKYFTVLSMIFGLSLGTYSQGGSQAIRRPSAIATNLARKAASVLKTDVGREKREQAFAKLFEGQRYFLASRRPSSRQTRRDRQRRAKNAFLRAIELNPKLAEAYTALAQLEWYRQSPNFEDILTFANIATKLDKDNFGGHHFAAIVYTIKSNLNRRNINPKFVGRAIEAWKEVSGLDPRNAEAWAFLSVFYEVTKQKEKRIVALRKWLSSVPAINPRFYANVMQHDGDLSPQAAATKLGEVLLQVKKNDEALKVLTRAVSDNPGNRKAISLLTLALENADNKALASPIEALRQAVFANPTNRSLVELLARTITRTGKIDAAIKVLRLAVNRSYEKNKFSASNLEIVVGDIFAESNRVDESISAYHRALGIRGIKLDRLEKDDEKKDFAYRVIDKIVMLLKKSDRNDEAKQLLKNSILFFGDSDVRLSKLRIRLLRDIGKAREALREVRVARNVHKDDIGLLRTEASILTGLGRVDEGVELVLKHVENKDSKMVDGIRPDNFSKYLFVSSLYTEARRERKAFVAAKRAFTFADNKEKRQIAKLNLAYAQRVFGKVDMAEKNLRNILAETPNYPIALNNLGYLLLAQGKKLNEAIGLIKRALVVEPDNARYLDSLGWAYFKTGNLNQAERLLKRAFRYDSSSATILEHLGDLYKKKGQNTKAKESWQRALNFAPENGMSKRIRGKLTK